MKTFLLIVLPFLWFQPPQHFLAFHKSSGTIKSVMHNKLKVDTVDIDITIDSSLIRVGKLSYRITDHIREDNQERVYTVRRGNAEYRIDIDIDRHERTIYNLGIYPIPQDNGPYEFYEMKVVP